MSMPLQLLLLLTVPLCSGWVATGPSAQTSRHLLLSPRADRGASRARVTAGRLESKMGLSRKGVAGASIAGREGERRRGRKRGRGPSALASTAEPDATAIAVAAGPDGTYFPAGTRQGRTGPTKKFGNLDEYDLREERRLRKYADLDAGEEDEGQPRGRSGQAEGGKEEERGAGDIPLVDLFARTWESLDFGVVLKALAAETATTLGESLALQPHFEETLEGVHEIYGQVEEIMQMQTSPPLGSTRGLHEAMKFAEEGTLLEPGELIDVSNALTNIQALSDWFQQPDRPGDTPCPRLSAIAERILLPPELLELLKDAFDPAGELNGNKFPAIGELRRQVRSLTDQITRTMLSLMNSDTLRGKLADEHTPQVTTIGGRFVVPVKPTFKRSVGIVHDRSRTGKTLYMEPTQVVEATNNLAEQKLHLAKETERILQQMTDELSKNSAAVREAMAATGAVDLANARARLGRVMRGVVPEVRDEGVVSLSNVRHPVLTLRGKVPVGNDLYLDGDTRQCLVLTGPNAGGKTVVLKSLGLVALMVRAGIPVPASEMGARVDLFNPVLADIGDTQSVTGDLSTFSGHLVTCKAVLESSGKGALVLMDEMGSGTDPAQGAALAQALLEALLDSGARVALTTHFLQLKDLAARDERFAVAAMSFADGKPTYRMVQGAVGESFALAVAEQMQLPSAVLERATDLLDVGVRQVSDLIRELEDSRALLDAQIKDTAVAKREAERATLDLRKEKEQVKALKLTAKNDAAREYASKLKEQEDNLRGILKDVRQNPSVKVIGSAIGQVRRTKREAEQEAADDGKEVNPIIEKLVPLSRKRHGLQVGDKVFIAQDSIYRGKAAIVSKIDEGKIYLNMGSNFKSKIPIFFKGDDLARPPEGVVFTPAAPAKKKPRLYEVKEEMKRQQLLKEGRAAGGGGGSGMSVDEEVEAERKSRRKSKNRQPKWEDGGGGRGGGEGGATRSPGRLPKNAGNSLDLRGEYLEQGLAQVKNFMGDLYLDGERQGYIVHGHGTGALKEGIREHLRRYKVEHKPADPSDGGDGVTWFNMDE